MRRLSGLARNDLQIDGRLIHLDPMMRLDIAHSDEHLLRKKSGSSLCQNFHTHGQRQHHERSQVWRGGRDGTAQCVIAQKEILVQVQPPQRCQFLGRKQRGDGSQKRKHLYRYNGKVRIRPSVGAVEKCFHDLGFHVEEGVHCP